MASKFRLNRYNWFGQKLLVQHQYVDIIKLHQYLTKSTLKETQPVEYNLSNGNTGLNSGQQPFQSVVRLTSEHLTYINGLALMKTSTRLDEVIYSLQRLSFDKSSQYFLLLCQCLLYLGNYDSVVEICKQIINKEIDTTSIIADEQDDKSYLNESQDNEITLNTNGEEGKPNNDLDALWNSQEKRKSWLESVKPESFESFKTVITTISRNKLINEPKLWFIFGLCLEQQLQFRDAFFAFKVASNMASGNFNSYNQLNYSAGNKLNNCSYETDKVCLQDNKDTQRMPISNYYEPHLKYVEFCIKFKADFKSAIQILNQVCQMFPQNYTLHPRLALLLSAQPNLNQANFVKSIEIISNLEMHSSANRNPSSGYNKIAAKFITKQTNFHSFGQRTNYLSEFNDENRSNLDYLLVKSHLIINSIVQDSNKSDLVYRVDSQKQSSKDSDNELIKRAELLLNELKNSEFPCWDSSSLWNNLGVCYLIKRRFIASLSCLTKASQLNAFDWRINYNLALACIHIGLYTKALTSLLAAKNIYIAQQNHNLRLASKDKRNFKVDPIINTLMAICFNRLNENNEARTLYIEAIRPQKSIPIISLINYLIFLHNFGQNEKQYVKLKLHLLDQLEQFWLQRNQNDCQLNNSLLEVARIIGDETSLVAQSNPMKKTYAWAKS